jgi:hypothetical protein
MKLLLFWVKAYHWELFSDNSKKHSSFTFKGFDCPEDYSRASRILKQTAMEPQVSSFILFANTAKDCFVHLTKQTMK